MSNTPNSPDRYETVRFLLNEIHRMAFEAESDPDSFRLHQTACNIVQAANAALFALSHAFGNAAKMRLALLMVKKGFDDSLICEDSQMSYEEQCRLDEIFNAVEDALVKPVRNCDLYATHKVAFEAWYEQSKQSDHWPVPIAEFGIWLLSSPKGGAK